MLNSWCTLLIFPIAALSYFQMTTKSILKSLPLMMESSQVSLILPPKYPWIHPHIPCPLPVANVLEHYFSLKMTHRFHNSYAHSHRYLSSVSVNTTSCSPSAHCCSLRKNSTCALAYEVPTYLSKISLHVFFSSLCYHLCLHWPSSSFWLCQAPYCLRIFPRCWEHLSSSPWQLRGDFLTPRWVTLLQVLTSLHVSLSNNFPQREL